MCDTHVFVVRDGKEELILENVDLIEAEDGILKVFSIFGEEKILKGRITRFSFREHKILISQSDELTVQTV
ncbi:MAG TPA: CooT family nickel-binding protein [Thermodesulfobacteriota bacterium]|nr:CooT family nickel-binding protein [Thermodesulfobacteriota bacterium]HNU72630.1 CooT family nickel-binding protein [Thermodesulfobacteriota bacterium]HOC38980.1 CooT family nickel-binding protein [Thermodesulfobacteriota bacterium]